MKGKKIRYGCVFSVFIVFFLLPSFAWTQECPCSENQELDIFIIPMPDSVRLSKNQTTLNSSFELQELYRYPAEVRKWVELKNDSVFTRDWFVGIMTVIVDPSDGETWTARGISPDGSEELAWPLLTFYKNYNGKENCLVTSKWVVVETTKLYVLWCTKVQCRTPGQWTIQFFDNGQFAFQGYYTIYPMIPPGKVPVYRQYDYAVDPDHRYDHICYTSKPQDDYPCYDEDWIQNVWNPFHASWDGSAQQFLTAVYENPLLNKYGLKPLTYPPQLQKYCLINHKGCYLSCCAMIMEYHGVDVDPPALNAWLKSQVNELAGYTRSGKLNLLALKNFSERITSVDTDPETQDNDKLDASICQYGPQIIGVDLEQEDGTIQAIKPKHFVVATGRDNNGDLLINDPGYSSRNKIPKNQWKGIRYVTGPEYLWADTLNELYITIYSPAELLLTDHLGRRIGFDPVNQKEYDEIPDSYYSYESIADLETGEAGTTTKEIGIKEPIDGAYQLQVIGTDSGLYSLEFLTQDQESNFSTKNFVGLMISEDEIHSYSFNYEKTVGYEIEVYSRLLSYDNAVKMTLPPGTTYFDMTIHYDKTILPATFIAKLNGLDVNNLFNPTPGGSETVTLNMAQSINTLFLSIDGITIYREVIHEADTLEFRVQTTGEENFKYCAIEMEPFVISYGDTATLWVQAKGENNVDIEIADEVTFYFDLRYWSSYGNLLGPDGTKSKSFANTTYGDARSGKLKFIADGYEPYRYWEYAQVYVMTMKDWEEHRNNWAWGEVFIDNPQAYFQIVASPNTIAHSDTSVLFFQAKGENGEDILLSDDEVLSIDTRFPYRHFIPPYNWIFDEKGTLVGPDGTQDLWLDNISYGDARTGKVKYVANGKVPDDRPEKVYVRVFFDDVSYNYFGGMVGHTTFMVKDSLSAISQPPNVPSVVFPPNRAKNVSTQPELSWSCSDPNDDPLTYDISFGTNAPPSKVQSNLNCTTFSPGVLDTSTTYYWSVLAKDETDSTAGPLWQFRTEFINRFPDVTPADSINIENQKPEIPSVISPQDGAIDVSIQTVLSWSCLDLDRDSLTYNIYLGKTVPPLKVHSDLKNSTFSPDTLEGNTVYYWYVVAKDWKDSTASPVWQFVTEMLNQPPVAEAGNDSIREATSPMGAEITLDGSGSYDPDGDTLTYTWRENDEIIAGPTTDPQSTVLFTLGEHAIELTVEDGQGFAITDNVLCTIVDTTPPELFVTLEPDTLWPANHKMISITATVVVADICDLAPTFVLSSITSSEPDDAPGDGDGNTLNDIQGAEIGTMDTEFLLRAERAGTGQGRFYRVAYSAVDAYGNSVSVADTVWVPHDKRQQ